MRNFVKKMWSDVVLGVLFVVSGFVKAVDPVGIRSRNTWGCFSFRVGGSFQCLFRCYSVLPR